MNGKRDEQAIEKNFWQLRRNEKGQKVLDSHK
jgi:hypothetical protein